MNFLENFAITVILGLLQAVVKNPAHAAALKTQLVGVANDIYATYGLTPPATVSSSPLTVSAAK